MKIIIAALLAATAVGVAAPAAMAQPYGPPPGPGYGYGPGPGPYWRHHHDWRRHGYYGWHGGRRAWCWHHPRAC